MLIVCVCALIRPKIRNKILTSCVFIQFVSTNKELSFVDKHIIHIVLNQFVVFIKMILVFRILKRTIDLQQSLIEAPRI